MAMWTRLVTDATSSGPLVGEASAAVVTSAASTGAAELSNSSLPKKYSPSRHVGFSLTVTVALRVLVDGDGCVGVREAADRRDAGDGAGGILVQVVRRVLGDNRRAGLGVVGGGYAVADGVVGKILVEAADWCAVLGAPGGDDFAPQVVAVGVHRAGEVAERLAGAGDRRAASRRAVRIAEGGDDARAEAVGDRGDKVAILLVGDRVREAAGDVAFRIYGVSDELAVHRGHLGVGKRRRPDPHIGDAAGERLHRPAALSVGLHMHHVFTNKIMTIQKKMRGVSSPQKHNAIPNFNHFLDFIDENTSAIVSTPHFPIHFNRFLALSISA